MYTIIIPTYGTKGISMLDDLLESISRFNNPSLNKIIISDDSSNENTIPELISLIDKYENIFKIIPIFNPTYHSFSKTVNRGMEISNQNEDILLLNNDMLATTSFEPFIDFIKEKQNNNQNSRSDQNSQNNKSNQNSQTNQNKIGIVGAKLLYPNRTIQHAGMVRMRLLNRFRHIYKYRGHNHPQTNHPKKYISTTGACLYIRRELIDKIGHFDERYILSYEDVDYCINAQYNGYEVWYLPDVVMIHKESATRTDPYYEQNRALFWRKWGSSYEAIRSNGNIPDDDLDIKVAEASGLTGLLYLISKSA